MRAFHPFLVRAAGAVVLAAAVAACGFQLRGSNGAYTMPFSSIFTRGPSMPRMMTG